jgi:hypothetical protein
MNSESQTQSVHGKVFLKQEEAQEPRHLLYWFSRDKIK